MKIYISGKISDNPTFREDFERAEQELIKGGWQVVNPARIFDLTSGYDWNDYIIGGLLLLKDCQALYLLDNWESSAGANIEVIFAKKNKIYIMKETK